jgi:hypothetical protein
MEKDGSHHIGLYFHGTNIDSWQFGMKLALQSDEPWQVTNGTEAKPETINLLVSEIPYTRYCMAFHMWSCEPWDFLHAMHVKCSTYGHMSHKAFLHTLHVRCSSWGSWEEETATKYVRWKPTSSLDHLLPSLVSSPESEHQERDNKWSRNRFMGDSAIKEEQSRTLMSCSATVRNEKSGHVAKL